MARAPVVALENFATQSADFVSGRVSSAVQEIAESTAGEAQKKLKDLNLHEKVGAGPPQQAVGLAFSIPVRVLASFGELNVWCGQS